MSNQDVASNRVHSSMQRMRKDLPQLESIFIAFEDLLAETAQLSEELTVSDAAPSDFDHLKFTSGVPLLGDDDLAPPKNILIHIADHISLILERSFPAIKQQVSVVASALQSDKITPDIAILAITGPDSERFTSCATDLEIEPSILSFILSWFVKPFAIKTARQIKIPEDYHWSKGYCPLCGSWPELSYLEGKEGHRFLRCSFCSNEWGFPRLECPFCETENQQTLELLYSDDRPYERAEICHECKKYIVGVDTRAMALDLVPETAAIGMVYLDILAQEKGYAPGAFCGWNVVDE